MSDPIIRMYNEAFSGMNDDFVNELLQLVCILQLQGTDNDFIIHTLAQLQRQTTD